MNVHVSLSRSLSLSIHIYIYTVSRMTARHAHRVGRHISASAAAATKRSNLLRSCHAWPSALTPRQRPRALDEANRHPLAPPIAGAVSRATAPVAILVVVADEALDAARLRVRAADHDARVDHAWNKAEACQDDGDDEFHAAAEAPEDPERRQDVGANQRAELVAPHLALSAARTLASRERLGLSENGGFARTRQLGGRRQCNKCA